MFFSSSMAPLHTYDIVRRSIVHFVTYLPNLIRVLSSVSLTPVDQKRVLTSLKRIQKTGVSASRRLNVAKGADRGKQYASAHLKCRRRQIQLSPKLLLRVLQLERRILALECHVERKSRRRRKLRRLCILAPRDLQIIGQCRRCNDSQPLGGDRAHHR